MTPKTKYLELERQQRAATISGWAQLAIVAAITAAVWAAIIRGVL